MSKLPKLITYYLSGWVLGLCMIIIPASSFIWKDPNRYGITDQQYGICFLPMVLATIMTSLGFKPILRRFGHSKVYTFGFVLILVFVLFLLLGTHQVSNHKAFTYLVLANAIFGLGFGLVLNVVNVSTVDLYPQKRTVVLTGLHSVLGIGAAASPLIINAFFQEGDWVWSLYFALGVVAAVLLGAWFTQAFDIPHHLSAQDPIQKKSEALPLWAYAFMLFAVIYGTAEATIANWSTSFLISEKNFSAQTTTICLSLFWGFLTLGRIGATLLSVKISPRYLYRVAPFVLAISLVGLLQVSSESQIYVIYALLGLGCSYLFPMTLSLASAYFDPWREEVAGLVLAGLMIGVGVGSSAVGALCDWGVLSLKGAFVIALVCSGLLGLSSILLTKRSL